jgi:hypothetical protein
MSIRTASAAGKLFLYKQTFGGEILMQFLCVSDAVAHAAVVRYRASDVSDVSDISFGTTTIQLSSLIEVDQEAAKVIWLIQTGEEL